MNTRRFRAYWGRSMELDNMGMGGEIRHWKESGEILQYVHGDAWIYAIVLTDSNSLLETIPIQEIRKMELIKD